MKNIGKSYKDRKVSNPKKSQSRKEIPQKPKIPKKNSNTAQVQDKYVSKEVDVKKAVKKFALSTMVFSQPATPF